MNANTAPNREKIYFRLAQDEDGYPPTTWESLWGKRVKDDLFEIDNIPFYVMDVSPGDKVRATLVDNRYEYQDTVFRSGNSVFRVYVYDESKIHTAREQFRQIGIQSELGTGKLFAIEIPEAANVAPALDLLLAGQDKGDWDIEEGSLRHAIPGEDS